MGRLEKFNAQLQDRDPDTPNLEELLNRKESAMNLAVAAETRMRQLSARGATPPELQHLQSVMVKLNEVASRPDNSPLLPVSWTPEERQQLYPLMGQYRYGTIAAASSEKFLPAEDIEAVTRAIALHPGQVEIAGILATDPDSAKERIARAINAYAQTDREDHRNIINDISAARNLLRHDQKVLEPLFTLLGRFGIDPTNVVEALDHRGDSRQLNARDWKARLNDLIDERIRVNPSVGDTIKSFWTKERLENWPFAGLSDRVGTYQKNAALRAQLHHNIAEALDRVFRGPGVAGKILTQEATQPNAPMESVQSYQALQKARTQMAALMNNPAQYEQSLRSHFRIGTPAEDPRWALRNDPVNGQTVSNALGREWLDGGFRNQMSNFSNTGHVGSFWSQILMTFLQTLLGTAYSAADRGGVANKIRSM